MSDDEDAIGTSSLIVKADESTPDNRCPLATAGPELGVFEPVSGALAPATFADSDAANTHAATIDWGDEAIEVEANHQDMGTDQVEGTHHDLDPGLYEVVVTVTDQAGELGGERSEVLVQSTRALAPGLLDQLGVMATWIYGYRYQAAASIHPPEGACAVPPRSIVDKLIED